MRLWRRRGEQAPHKPLLLLYALRRVQLGESRLVDFNVAESPLRELIERFSPNRARVHPEYPFWRLQHDGLWEVEDAETFPSRKSNTDPPLTELRNRHAEGGFPTRLDAALRADPRAVAGLAQAIVSRFFPDEEVGAVLEAVGLEQTA